MATQNAGSRVPRSPEVRPGYAPTPMVATDRDPTTESRPSVRWGALVPSPGQEPSRTGQPLRALRWL